MTGPSAVEVGLEGPHLGLWGLPPHEEWAEGCAPHPLIWARRGSGNWKGLPPPQLQALRVPVCEVDTYCPLLVVGGMDTTTQPGSMWGSWAGGALPVGPGALRAGLRVSPVSGASRVHTGAQCL